MAKPAPRCIRCNQRMRNDGTAEQPKWVCNNLKCVRYVPEQEPEEEQEVVVENATTTEQETDLES